MLTCSNGVKIVQDESELPRLEGINLYLDLETTSGDPSKTSINPWHHCKIAGVCIAVDNSDVFYVPLGHFQGRNIDARQWLVDTMRRTRVWVNHNVKYDAHVVENETGYRYEGKLVDTITLAKLYYSDRYSYSLDALCEEWLHDNKQTDLLAPYLVDNKDYGRIPIDILGAYGGYDVILNRRLFKFLQDNMHDDCRNLANIEVGVTGILYETERLGMRIQPNMLKAMNIHYIQEMFKLEHKILDTTGYNIRPHVNDDCYDLLCNGYGLPVVRWTNEDDDEKDSNPSFNKDALQAYLAMPGAPTEVVEMLLAYRQMNTFRSLFLETYIHLHVDGILHPDYNQTVRTGRMSARRPNAQQLNKNAKKLILPHEGHSFLSVDYSQIEFRLIVHYIQNQAAINSYCKNPDTDFHTWVAEMCHIPRRPAKNVNFCMGYGGGKAKLLSMLSAEPTLVEEIKSKIDAAIEKGTVNKEQAMTLFEAAAGKRALDVYKKYHDALPELRPTSYRAGVRAKDRGYVYNLFGRRRYLPPYKSHIAFNALNQGTAADIMKERLVAVHQVCKDLGIAIAAVVHDEVLFHGPTDVIDDPRTVHKVIECLEQPEVDLSLPLRCSYGTSAQSWYHAGLAEAKLPLEQSTWHAA
jgi:DNA polymerase-1